MNEISQVSFQDEFEVAVPAKKHASKPVSVASVSLLFPRRLRLKIRIGLPSLDNTNFNTKKKTNEKSGEEIDFKTQMLGF
mmetsp:Transcript_87623/g.233304  ORF Transcript_87623/g.233304 Transcript_87623/m.233304 type:complete len:80 (+) Transcript_87623:159-398(+)